MRDSWHTYPKIFNLGHRAIADIFNEEVLIEEKIDGSQFSFCRDGDELLVRSKGCIMNVEAPEKMFQPGVDTAKRLFPDLMDGWTYRGEFLAKPKHNALVYDRIPSQHFVVFDVNTGNEAYLSYEAKTIEANRLGLEVVPAIHRGRVDNISMFRELIDRVSMLGGQKVEGVVVKNYQRYTIDGKAMFGKFVSESFKEVHGASWREENPTKSDIIEQLVAKLKTPARWAKAVQHLREQGKIEDSPKDIGLLIREAQADVRAECAGDISEFLLRWALPQVERKMIHGLPDWYKEELLKLQFSEQT